MILHYEAVVRSRFFCSADKNIWPVMIWTLPCRGWLTNPSTR